MAVDSAIRNKLKVPEISEETKEKLSKILPKFASLKNPVDTTANINPNEYKMALKILDEDSQFDGIIAIVVRAYTKV